MTHTVQFLQVRTVNLSLKKPPKPRLNWTWNAPIYELDKIVILSNIGGIQAWHKNNFLMRINYTDIWLGFVTEDHLRIRTGMKSEKVDLA